MKEYGFTDLVDVEKLRDLMDLLYKSSGVPVGIIDEFGNQMAMSGWQDICLDYHLANDLSAKRCQESREQLLENLLDSEYVISKCENGLYDLAAPVMKEGRHLATIILGQFFFKDDEVSVEYFQSQASEYGYDEEKYMAALREVPVFSREQIENILSYYRSLVEALLDQGLYRWKLSREVEERKKAEKSLAESFRFLSTLIDTIPNPVYYKNTKGAYLECNTAFTQQILGIPRDKIVGKTLFDFPERIPEERARLYHQKDEELISKPGIQKYEAPVKCADGLLRVFLFSKATLSDENGNVIGIVGVMLDISKRKSIEEALRESQARLQQISESALDAILMIDNRGLISFWNKAAEKMFGYQKSEIMDRNLHDILAPVRFHAKHTEAFKEFTLTGLGAAIGRTLELAAIRKDGTEFPIELSVSRIDKDGEFHAVGIVRDITERKKTENALKDTLDELEAVLENSLVGILVMTNRMIRKVNRRTAEIFKCETEDLVGKSTRVLYKSDKDYEKFGAKNYPALMENDYVHDEFPFIRSDGKTILLKLSGQLLVPSDLTKGVVWVIDDITERKRIENALKKSEQRFRDITYAAGQYIWESDKDGRFTFLSDRVSTIYGYKPEEMLGKTGFEYLPKDEHERMTNWFKKLIESGDSFKDFEHRFLHSSGQERWQRMSGDPMYDDDGNYYGYRGTGIDITEQKIAEEEKKKMEAQIQHSQKMESLGILAGGVAHDFNNILMGIIGNADLAHLSIDPNSPVTENIDTIIDSANRAAQLSRQLLAYSGHGKFLIETTDINEIIDDLKNLFDISISRKTTINYNLSEALPPIKVDVSQVQQILMNLITNASEAIGDNKGEIIITTDCINNIERIFDLFGQVIPPGRYISLEVSDTGCGIDKESFGRIFDPFYTTKFTGRGLGLAAVHGIVRGHHGSIQLESKPDKGTSLKIFIPAIKK